MPPWINTNACSTNNQHNKRVSGKLDQRHAIRARPAIAHTTSNNQVRRSRAIHQETATATSTPPASSQRSARFGGIAIPYGDGLLERIETAAPQGLSVALDAAGTDEAIDASLSLVYDRSRIVTIAAQTRAAADGFVAIGGNQPDSMAFRDEIRGELVQLAERAELVVPIARTYPLSEAVAALALVASGKAGGKVALLAGNDTGSVS